MKQTLILVLLITVLLMAGCAKTTDVPVETPTTTIPTAEGTCGDGTCDNSEMCNIQTLETECPADCGPCPSSIYVEPLQCGDSNCQKTGNNEFTVKIPSYIKANIANLGETIANTMGQEFKCYSNDKKVVQTALLKNYKGVQFNDYFDNRDKSDEVRLTSRTTEGSKIVYRVDLTRWQQNPLEDYDITCNFVFSTHGPIVNDKQTWIIKFRN
ncbi:MAG: hypothetical protein PHF86_11505 [Candidatus Nanoarchaeia archaeon]|nr:hypothetical protein [Candidatus Nanoarchaeia archaeon]